MIIPSYYVRTNHTQLSKHGRQIEMGTMHGSEKVTQPEPASKQSCLLALERGDRSLGSAVKINLGRERIQGNMVPAKGQSEEMRLQGCSVPSVGSVSSVPFRHLICWRPFGAPY